MALRPVTGSQQTIAPSSTSAVSGSGIKEKCRRALAATMHHTGLLGVPRRLGFRHELQSSSGRLLPKLKRSSGSKFGIVCYHRVGKGGVPLFSQLEPRVFESQMRHIKTHYRLVPLGQLCQELRESQPVKPTLAVTFDDGYRDLYTHAFPILQKYAVPSTVYLIANCMQTGLPPWYDSIFVALQHAAGTVLELDLDRPRQFSLSSPSARFQAAWEIVCFLRSVPDAERRKWCEAFHCQLPAPSEALENRILNWDQVRKMYRGGVSFGCHTSTHPAVSRLDPRALEKEICQSKNELEAGLDAPMVDFAYPFGKPADCGFVAEPFLSAGGYRSAVTTSSGFNPSGTNAFRLRRMQIGDNPSLSLFAFELARVFLESESTPSCDSPAGGASSFREVNSVRRGEYA